MFVYFTLWTYHRHIYDIIYVLNVCMLCSVYLMYRHTWDINSVDEVVDKKMGIGR